MRGKHIELRVLLKVSRMMKIFLPVFLTIMKNCITLCRSILLNGQIYTNYYNKICNECINHIVNVNDVENPIKTLKPGKSDGFDGLTSDYLINASPLFYVYLSHLFTDMLYYCFTPKSFCISTMIPIPKGSNKDTSDLRNYRGIALSSLLSKLFDSCIISLNTVVFKSDDLQFAYKKSCSTIQCVSMVTEVIDYYQNNGSPIYMCMLDASKAFDRVNLLTLFKTLYSRGMCPYLPKATDENL